MRSHAPSRRTAQLASLLITGTLLCGVRAAPADNAFSALIGSAGLEHFIGDKQHWSFQAGVLTGRLGADAAPVSRLVATERIGNFVLQFAARAAKGNATVLVRGSVSPIGFVTGYKAGIGRQNAGDLSVVKPPSREKMMAAFASGGRSGPPQPEESSLIDNASASESPEWQQYEVAALGDHLVVKINGQTTAHYRDPASSPEGALVFELNGPAEVEIKDLRIQLFDDVRWKETPAGKVAADAGDFEAAPARVQRLSDAERSNETQKLLAMAASGEGFRPLLESDKDWKTPTREWSIQDGVIQGQSVNTFLVTEKQYSDFILKAAVRLSPQGNSGIQFRSAVVGPEGRVQGHQLDMGVNEFGGRRIIWWGQIYHEGTPRGILYPVVDQAKRASLVREGDWNDVVLICSRSHMIVQLNGQTVADLLDYPGEKSGVLAFQMHVGPVMKVEFRNVTIKEL